MIWVPVSAPPSLESGRYAITLPPEAIRQIFQTHGELPNWPAYYNAAPTTALPVVRQAKDGGGRELVLMQWADGARWSARLRS
jgi:putative SOS response-associated peptidase YedK